MKKLLFAILLFCGTLKAQVQIFGDDQSITGQATQSATINNIIPTTAGANGTLVNAFRSFSVQLVGTATGGTIIFEGSMDNSTYVPIIVYNSGLVIPVPIVTSITQTTSGLIYGGAITCNYIRVRIATTLTGGTIRAYTKLLKTPFATTTTVVANGTAANLLANVGQTGTWTVQQGNTPGTGAWLFEPRTGTTNGSTSTAVNSAATTNAAFLKASAGMVYSVMAMNASAAVKYVRIFNKASAPTMGTDVPVMVIAIPATSSKEITIPLGLKLSAGIAYAITNAAPAIDNTAVAAADVQLLIDWQ